MKVPRILAALALACTVSIPAYANCHLPPAPSKIPRGATASKQQMITAMQTIREYNHDVQTYLKCLDFEVRQNLMTSDNQTSLHNAAVDQMERIAAKFNRQVVIFKSKHS